uniref:Uncharacterized protein n=1 Tax=Solanum lycopersicum TaxID=4081 RepID=A0A3Q7IVT4_SOLLC
MALYVLDRGCAFERAKMNPLFFELHLEALFSSSVSMVVPPKDVIDTMALGLHGDTEPNTMQLHALSFRSELQLKELAPKKTDNEVLSQAFLCCLPMFNTPIKLTTLGVRNKVSQSGSICSQYAAREQVHDAELDAKFSPHDVIDTIALYVLDRGFAFERAKINPLFFELHLEALFSSSGLAQKGDIVEPYNEPE